MVGGVRWAKGVPFGEHRTNVVEIHQMVASDDSGTCYGQFMTDLEVNDARRALEVGTWGKKICEALHYYDYSATELETVYMNHAYEDACLLTS